MKTVEFNEGEKPVRRFGFHPRRVRTIPTVRQGYCQELGSHGRPVDLSGATSLQTKSSFQFEVDEIHGLESREGRATRGDRDARRGYEQNGRRIFGGYIDEVTRYVYKGL